MFSIFFAYTLFVQMLSPLSGEHFLHTAEKNIHIKPIAITFDDGPHRVRTGKILDILKSRSVPATFFVVGNRLPHEEDLLRRMVIEGHQIGNHSFSHPILTKTSFLDFFHEIIATNLSIWVKTGVYPHLLRFPYGLADARIHIIYSGKIIGWSVDAADWKEKDPQRLTQKILIQTQSGSIILLHDIKEDTISALPAIIDGLRAHGYTFMSLDQLLPEQETREQKSGIWLNATKNIPIGKNGETISRMVEPHTDSPLITSPISLEGVGNF